MRSGRGVVEIGLGILVTVMMLSRGNEARAATVPYSTYALHFAQARCQRFVQCGQLDNTTAAMNACVEQQLPLRAWNVAGEEALNRISFDETACLQAIGTSRCDYSDAYGVLYVNCAGLLLITPKQSAGQACIANEECINSYCAHPLTSNGIPGTSSCPGTCTAYKLTGATCASYDECNPGTDLCLGGKCTAAGAAGATCNDVNSFCRPGLLCPSFATTRRCQQPNSSNILLGACDPAQGAVTAVPECTGIIASQLLWCQPNRATNPTSASCALKVLSGFPCNPALNSPQLWGFANNQCTDGTTCYTTGAAGSETCRAWGSAGAACIDGSCKQTLYCAHAAGQTVGTCKAMIADGQTCNPSDGLTCVSSLSPTDNRQTCLTNGAGGFTCVPRKGWGATCRPTTEDDICVTEDVRPGFSVCQPSGSSGTCAQRCQ